MIKVEGISKSYGAKKALDGVSFAIGKGEIVGFLGPNGAGKSTMMKIINSYLIADKGKVEVGGEEVHEANVAPKKNIGYLPENNPLYGEMYVREYLDYVASLYKVDKGEIDVVIEKTGLAKESAKKIEELSKGYKQRVGIAAAIIHNPDYLILDEPTTGLDPNQIVDIRKLISDFSKEKTVLLSTHIMQEVEAMCERVILIKDGKIVKDQALEDFTSEDEDVCKLRFKNKVDINQLMKLEGVKKADTADNLNFKLEFESDDILGVLNNFAQSESNIILSFSIADKSLEESFRELTK